MSCNPTPLKAYCFILLAYSFVITALCCVLSRHPVVEREKTKCDNPAQNDVPQLGVTAKKEYRDSYFRLSRDSAPNLKGNSTNPDSSQRLLDPSAEQDLLEQQLAIDLFSYSRVTDLSDEKRKRLEAHLRKFQTLLPENISEEDADQHLKDYETGIEEIVGKKAVDDLAALQAEEGIKSRLQKAEAEANYIARALNLPDSQIEDLINALGATNREAEEQISYFSHSLKLSQEEEKLVRETWNAGEDFDKLNMYLNSIGGRAALDQSFFTYASSKHDPDWEKVRKLSLYSALKSSLSESQKTKLLELIGLTPEKAQNF